MIREISCPYTEDPGSLNYANKFHRPALPIDLASLLPPSPSVGMQPLACFPSQLRRRIVPDDKSNVDEASGLIEPARINWPCLENAKTRIRSSEPNLLSITIKFIEPWHRERGRRRGDVYICKRFHRSHSHTDYIFPWNFIDSNLESRSVLLVSFLSWFHSWSNHR